jgi:chloramphenicol 3-O-phosphotransferase
MTALASPANASGEQAGVAVAVVVDIAVVGVAVVGVDAVVGATVVDAAGFEVVGDGVIVVETAIVDVAPNVEGTDVSVVGSSSPQDALTVARTTTEAATASRRRTMSVSQAGPLASVVMWETRSPLSHDGGSR